MRKLTGLLVLSLTQAAPLAADEVSVALGAREFAERCAVCHGSDAAGGGPLAAELRVEPTDLTTLAKEHGGVFPFERVYQIIDGRIEVRGHGTRTMPVWGYEYQQIAREAQGPAAPRVDSEYFILGRILSLIRFLQSLQKQ